jgi:two-component system sensor histidine kinase ChiS
VAIVLIPIPERGAGEPGLEQDSFTGISLYGSLKILRPTLVIKGEKLRLQENMIALQESVNKRLLRVDKLKDQFLANTSHELRTPLNGIIGLAESLIDGATGQLPKAAKANLRMITSSGRRLASLVNDILDFSRIKNRELSLQIHPTDIYTLADVVLHLSKPLVKGKKLQLINAVPKEFPLVEGDESRLQQILFNLVGNAIKFTEKGYVKIGSRESPTGPTSRRSGEVRKEQKMIEIFVEDTGIGIPENKRKAIFQEFEQADGSASREFAGTGLGLSISKKLVELHGGQMWVESDVGKGSRFYFSIPISDRTAKVIPPTVSKPLEAPAFTMDLPEETAVAEDASPAIDPKDDSEQVRILVVDDEAINQQVLRNHLSSKNYHLISAMNGEEALRAIESGPPFDLVLLDIMMPRMSGYEVCEKIREKYLPSELPIIMITAKNQVQDLVQGFAMGANDYLAKPFSKAEFLARVKTQLNLRHIQEATGRFVPYEFIRALDKEGITDVKLGDHVAREVTVLFTDIRDYTKLAESMDPEENFLFVNDYLGKMGPVIQAHSGFINQYLGDGIMAIFQHRSEDALMAAIAMQDAVRAYNKDQTRNGRSPIRVGMGMHTGSLIMGIIGDHRRTEAATISDTVNTASRMEGLTKYFNASILLSEYSLAAIADPAQFSLRYLGLVKVKGKKTPIEVYECFDGDPPAVIEKNGLLPAILPVD